MSSKISMEACRSYAQSEITEALNEFDVVKYQIDINTKVNDLCLEMGYLCKGNAARFEELTQELASSICTITEDREELKKIANYANRIMTVGKNYANLCSQ